MAGLSGLRHIGEKNHSLIDKGGDEAATFRFARRQVNFVFLSAIRLLVCSLHDREPQVITAFLLCRELSSEGDLRVVVCLEPFERLPRCDSCSNVGCRAGIDQCNLQ
jgi:hypothetical protein